MRLDPKLTKRVLEHIYEHLDHLKTTDPHLLAILGEKGVPSDRQKTGSAKQMGRSAQGAAEALGQNAFPDKANMPNQPEMPDNPLTGAKTGPDGFPIER